MRLPFSLNDTGVIKLKDIKGRTVEVKLGWCSDVGASAVALGDQSRANPWPHMDMGTEVVRSANIFGLIYDGLKRRAIVSDLTTLTKGAFKVHLPSPLHLYLV